MRRKIQILTALLVLAVFLILAWPRSATHRITTDGFAWVRWGMTLAQVEQVLGGPEGNYGNGPPNNMTYTPARELATFPCAVWRATKEEAFRTSSTAIFVVFNSEGVVVDSACANQWRDAPWLAWLKRTLGL